MKSALIIGASGQDGAYLSQFLLRRGYRVFGTSRSRGPFDGLERLEVADEVEMLACELTDASEVTDAVERADPDEVYFLAAQSSVWKSFQMPDQTVAAANVGAANIIKAVQEGATKARIFNAASGDCFGPSLAEDPINESSPFRPRSPYAAAKCGAHYQFDAARRASDLFACTGFLFNHESKLRPESFATGKMIAAVQRIAAGSDETLSLGNCDVVRDWGWAPEYVEAMWLMLQQDEPRDFVIATGRSHPLHVLIAKCFAYKGLDWKRYVTTQAGDPRPSDIVTHHADPSAIERSAGWTAQSDIDALAAQLVGG